MKASRSSLATVFEGVLFAGTGTLPPADPSVGKPSKAGSLALRLSGLLARWRSR